LVSINEFTQCRAQLVLGWVIIKPSQYVSANEVNSAFYPL